MSETRLSPGAKFRAAIEAGNPLQVVGTVNAFTAMMAEQIGHQAIYLSGGGVANISYGLPDLGMTSLNDVIVDVQRITAATTVPLLVDIDTGWGGAFNIAKTIRDMEKGLDTKRTPPGLLTLHSTDCASSPSSPVLIVRHTRVIGDHSASRELPFHEMLLLYCTRTPPCSQKVESYEYW